MVSIINMIINYYCDFMIYYHTKIKNVLIHTNVEEYILNNDEYEIEKYINSIKSKHIELYCTRNVRHNLYKHLKSKKSPFTVYSYGIEDNHTKKKIIIKNKQ